MRFRVGGKKLTSAEALNLFSDPKPALRKAAAKEVGSVLGQNARLFSLVTNTLAKDKEIEDRWRSFARPISSRNLANFVEDAVVDALISAVRDAYPRLSHRYYRLKARWFGVEILPYWDRNAPLPDEEEHHDFPWPEAQRLVLERLWRLLARHGGDRPALFRASVDRRAGARRKARAPSRIRRCRARIPISSSTISAARAT